MFYSDLLDVGEEDRIAETSFERDVSCDTEDCEKCPRKGLVKPIPGNHIPIIPGLPPYHPYYQLHRQGGFVGQFQHPAVHLATSSGQEAPGRCPSPPSAAAMSLAAMRSYLLATQSSATPGQTSPVNQTKMKTTTSDPREVINERRTPPTSGGTSGPYFLYNHAALVASLASMPAAISGPQHLSISPGMVHGPKFSGLGQFNPRESLKEINANYK